MFQCEYARETCAWPRVGDPRVARQTRWAAGSRTKATSVTFGYASWMRAAASGSQR